MLHVVCVVCTLTLCGPFNVELRVRKVQGRVRVQATTHIVRSSILVY